MARERELRVQIVGDASGAKRAFNDVEKSGDQMSKKFGGWASAAGALFTGAIAGGAAAAAVEMVNLGAKLEVMQAKAAKVFGSSLGKVEKWAKGNANAMGLTSNEAVGLAAGLGDLLVPMGFAREQAAQMSTDVLQLSGALSMWSGGQKSAAEVAEILTSAILGEYDALKGLGINLGAADVEARKAQQGMSGLSGEADKQATALAVIAELIAQTADAQAEAASGADSTLQKITETQAKWREFTENVAGWTVTTAVPALTDLWENFQRGREIIMDNTAFQNFVTALELMWRSAQVVNQAFAVRLMQWWQTLRRAASEVGQAISDYILTPLQRAWELVQRLFEQFARLGRFNPLGPGSAPTSAPAPAPTRNLTGGIAGALSGAAINVQVNTTGVVGMTVQDVASAVQRDIEAGMKTAALVGS